MTKEIFSNVLAVDDDFAVRMGMEFIFKKWPEYKLYLAEDPDDALKKLDERDYLMMFCDIHMPIMSGLELLKIVKSNKPDLPVVMLTSETDIQNSITAFRHGAMDYILKPMTVSTVRGALEKATEFSKELEKKRDGIIDVTEFRSLVDNFSPEKMGLYNTGSKSAEFTQLVNALQEKLIHPGKAGRIHNLFLLTKSGIVIGKLTTNKVDNTDADIMGSMFTAIKDFMEDAVSQNTESSLEAIHFGAIHIKFGSAAFTDLAIVYTGTFKQDAENAITDAVIAFELENMAVLENWDGDMAKVSGADRCLEELFAKIDKSDN